MKLAVVPARGGSKRIPRKNIKLFGGKPILSYAVSVARASGLFDAIVVSSEDAEILALAEDLGAKPLHRPDELADDYTPTVPVIAHAISVCESWGWQPDPVCCIYPAVPFLQPQDLVNALSMLDQREADYIFPVVAFPSPIQRALRLAGDGKVTPFFVGDEYTRTQDLEPAYHDAGQFYWGRTSAWVEGKGIHTHGYAMAIPGWQAVDIDTPDDWIRAEMIQLTIMVRGNKP
jgi:pseudaminic acid cytidylyltransferase